MVRITTFLTAAALAAPLLVHAESMARVKRAKHTAEAAAVAAATPSSTFTGTLPPSISSIIATITSGTGDAAATVALAKTFTAGAKNPSISNAPPLPTAAIVPSDYPALDVVPPSDSAQAKAWLAQYDLSKVPNIPPNNANDYSCAGNPANAANAQANGWWTCGGWTRDTDLTTCPDKNTWGLSYDDGPSPYTPALLDYLDEHNLKSTFFVVGSRAISRPEMLQTEYMSGHQLSVHTWSHPPLTTLSNEQIVLELAWTREAIRRITGVSPNTMRPPYGDIDDRVRAICSLMGLTPIIWTSANGQTYDTEDWQIGAGVVTAAEVVVNFEGIIKNASSLSTGYIVLAHDLYQQSVELATEVVLPFALQQNPKQSLMPIISCLHKTLGESYVETSSNQTKPYQTGSAKPSSGGSSGSSGSGSSGSSGSNAATTGGSSGATGLAVAHMGAIGGALVFGALAVL